MKKYFIVLILGLFLGVCFARSAYSQENYFTPMTALQANQENSESKEENSESKEDSSEIKTSSAQDAPSYYYVQYTYTEYEDCEDFFETKYAIYFQNTKYSDIEFTLRYEQPLVLYHSALVTAPSIEKFVNSMSQNIIVVSETIEYCRLMGYEDEIIQSLSFLCSVLYNQYSCIQDYALKCLDAYKKEDFSSCIKYILQMENVYWELYIQFGTFKNSIGANQVRFTCTTEEELEQEPEEELEGYLVEVIKMETTIFEYTDLTTEELASLLAELNREYNILKLKRKNGKWVIEVRKWQEN